MKNHPPLLEGGSEPLVDSKTPKNSPAVDFLIKTSRQFSKDHRLTVLVIGAATDVASAILTDPSTAGVMASYASLGDVILAEPGALIGFAGPRVIQDTIGEELPPGFQRSDFVLEHGMVDAVVHRKEMRETAARLLGFLWQSTDGFKPAPADALYRP